MPSLRHPYHGRCPFHLLAQTTAAEMDLLMLALDMAPPQLDIFEVGTAYAGSAYFGAVWAKRHGRRLWCIDQFGRPGALLPDEPTLELAFAHLRAEDLHRWTVLVPGSTDEVDGMFAEHCFGFGFIDGTHDFVWGIRDGEFAQRVLCSGGLLAFHDLWPDRRYGGLVGAVEELRDRYGWEPIRQADSTVLFRLP